MRARAIQTAACVLVGLLLGWWIWHPRPAPAEGEALARTLPKSGAEVLARDPAAEVPKPIKDAIKESGGKVERVVRLTVQPRPVQEAAESEHVAASVHTGQLPTETDLVAAPPPCSCAPVQVDLALVRMEDGTRRALALGTNGEQIAGMDIPFTLPAQRADPRWSALALYGPDGYGGGGTRRIGPVELGAAAIKFRGEVAAFAVAIVRF